MIIKNNAALTNIDKLSNLTSVGGNLYIQFNTALTNIDGLSNLTSVGGNLYIFYNAALTEFCGLYNLLNTGGLIGSYNITNNAANPTQQDIIDAGACIIQPPTLGNYPATTIANAGGNATVSPSVAPTNAASNLCSAK